MGKTQTFLGTNNDNLNASLYFSKWGNTNNGNLNTISTHLIYHKKTLFIRRYATLSVSNNQGGKKEKLKVIAKVTNSWF